MGTETKTSKESKQSEQEDTQSQESQEQQLCYGVRHGIAYVDSTEGQVICNYTMFEKNGEYNMIKNACEYQKLIPAMGFESYRVCTRPGIDKIIIEEKARREKESRAREKKAREKREKERKTERYEREKKAGTLPNLFEPL